MLGEKKGQTRFYFAENDGIITSAVPKIKDFDRDLATPLLQGHAHGFVIRTSRRTLKQSSGRLSKPCITCEKREPFFAYGAQKLVCFLGSLPRSAAGAFLLVLTSFLSRGSAKRIGLAAERG